MDEVPFPPPTNGKGAAAILAVGVGSLVLGVFTLSGDAIPAAARFFNIWNPTGPLSGVTGFAIVIWLAVWWILARLWGGRNVSLKTVNWATGLMVVLSLLLTFPPIMDVLQGKESFFTTAEVEMKRRLKLLAGLCLVTATTAAGPAFAGPPFITDDPEPVELGHWEVYGFSYGANGHGDTNGLGPSLEVNYGAAPGLQLHFIGGFAYDHQGGSLNMGVSDTELGAKLRFVDPEKGDWYPQVGIFPIVVIPTGNAKRGLGAGEWQEFLPLWLQKDWDDWTTYGGGGYWINPGPGNRNYWFFGWLLQRKIMESLTMGGELFHQTSSTVGGSASSGFNLGGQYDFTDHDHLLFSAGRGGNLYAINPAAGYPTTYYIAYQWTS